MPLLPENYHSNSTSLSIKSVTINSQILYSSVIMMLLMVAAALPFVSCPIYLQADGSFQVAREKIMLLAPKDGYVLNVNMKNNQKVSKGSLLLMLDPKLLDSQEEQLAIKERGLSIQLSDLNMLLKDLNPKNIKSGLLRANYEKFKTDFISSENAFIQAKRDYNRFAGLLQKKAISVTEFEAYEIQYRQMRNNLNAVVANYNLQLQTDVKVLFNTLTEVRLSRKLIEADRKSHYVYAPESGNIREVVGLSNGTFVHANQKIGELTPDGNLIAYCYFGPNDISLITKDQRINFQIDAFAHNQLGTISGKVSEIDEEATLINGASFFKVTCKISSPFLKLRNGLARPIRKGMMFKASLRVGEKTLWQLLTEKSFDWLKTIKIKTTYFPHSIISYALSSN